MANTLRFKRGLVATIPTAALGEPLFTTDTFDLYIGNGTTNTRFQKYIASGATTQILRGDGSLYTFPLAISSPSAGQVLKYNGTSWVNDSDAGITGSGSAGQVAYFTGATTQSGSNNLFWDATNSRLGIGTNTPAFKLDVASASGYNFIISRGASGQYFETYTNAGTRHASFGSESNGDTYLGSRSNNPLIFLTNATERARITSGGNFIINNASTDNGLRFQVTGDGYFSGSVGIGTSSPARKLDVYGSAQFLDASGIATTIWSQATTGAGGIGTNNNYPFAFLTNGTEKMRLDASGNLGLGVTPNTWNSPFKVIQIGASTSLWNISGVTGSSNNHYNDAANRYIANGFATIFQHWEGKFAWLIAPNNTSGAGAAATFTQAMTLDASGHLALGSTSADPFSRGYTRMFGISTATASGSTAIELNGGSGGYGQIDFGAGGVRTAGISGSANETQWGSITAIPAIIFTNSSERIRVFSDGNVGIATGNSNAGYKLDVNGTMRVSGASTFNGAMTLSINQNAGTIFSVSNTTSGTASAAYASFTSSNGNLQLGKRSATTNTYKILIANDSFIYNDNSGDIGILNDFASGSIKLAAGGSSTAHFTIASTGAATFSSSVTGASFIPSSSTIPTNGMYLSAANTLAFATASGNKLTISSTGLATFTDSARFSNLKGCIFVQTGGSLLGSISMDSSNQITIDNNGFFGLSVGSNYTMTGGNLGIGHAQFGTSATRTISVVNGTAPSTSPTDAFQIYSNDVVAGNAAPHFRTENGAIIKLYQETTAVGNSTISVGGGNAVLDDTEFDGYTLRQIVRALRNQGILQ